MAAITSNNVTVIDAYRVGDFTNKQRAVYKRVKITLSAQGGTVGDIPASALGFSKFYDVSSAMLEVSSVPKAVLVFLNAAGTELITANLAQATDANRIDRANLTGDLYVTVYGWPN